MNVVVIKGYCFIHSSILDPSLSLQIGKIWHFRCSALTILRSCYIHSRTRDPPLSLARIFCPDGNAPVATGHKRSNTDGRFQSTQNFNRGWMEGGGDEVFGTKQFVWTAAKTIQRTFQQWTCFDRWPFLIYFLIFLNNLEHSIIRFTLFWTKNIWIWLLSRK